MKRNNLGTPGGGGGGMRMNFRMPNVEIYQDQKYRQNNFQARLYG
jgi:hypothetical protein